MYDFQSDPEDCLNELDNFEKIAKSIKPSSGEIPELPGIEIYGETFPLLGEVGGDHLIYIDFNKRFDIDARIAEALEKDLLHVQHRLEGIHQTAGILLADAAGHSITDALLTAMLHQAFLVGVDYELSINGEVTTDLFESINTRFANSFSFDKFITMLYGEIHQNGEFRFIAAGHPLPVLFSAEYNRLVCIEDKMMSIFPPIGTMPSAHQVDAKKQNNPYGFKPPYAVNTINIMGTGDIMVLFTDGFQDQKQGEFNFVSHSLQDTLRDVKDCSAREIVGHLREVFFEKVPERDDDVTVVVIKKNN